MLKAPKNNTANRHTWARRLALFFLIIYFVVFLTAHITIIANVNHECIGDGCPICKLFHNAETLLKQIGKTAISVPVLFTALFVTIAILMNGVFSHISSSPVNVKVRLNN